MSTTYEILGDRACTPCSISDAHGVAIIAQSAGLNVEYQPFRHPALLDDEIRIRVDYSGLCQSDAMMMKNSYGMTHFPLVAGHEILGVVTHVGEKVTEFQVGDRVGQGPQKGWCKTCEQCRAGFNNVCPKGGFTIGLEYGGWATSFQSKAYCFAKIPDSLPGSAAPLLCAGLTVYSPLSREVQPGMKVGIVGIGGLGHLGIQYARAMGCEVTAISTSPDKEQEAREFGASHFVNSKDPQSLRKATNSLGFILDTALVYDLNTDLSLLRPRGVLTFVGAPEVPTKVNLDIFDMLFKNAMVKGSAAGSHTEAQNMLEFSARNRVLPKCEVYKFSDAKAALDSLALGQPRAPRYRACFETASFFETFTPNN